MREYRSCVYAAANNRTAFVHNLKRFRNKVAGGGEQDGSIQLFGRSLAGVAGPKRAQAKGKLL